MKIFKGLLKMILTVILFALSAWLLAAYFLYQDSNNSLTFLAALGDWISLVAAAIGAISGFIVYIIFKLAKTTLKIIIIVIIVLAVISFVTGVTIW